MPDLELKELLAKLRQELADTDSVSEETRALVHQLDEDLHKLIGPNAKAASGDSPPDNLSFDALMDRTRELEGQFATHHPVAERFVAQILDTLAKMGI